ncbi:hypothetical protein [Streptomyces sp. B15]|uniref:hypothetical protein n=1 Tax=Streptomyces sp. B15 TaxID=1537797 RepID=UPI001B364FEB|nr:hypothetical protein [Streptomyces sp. B15]MBQ1122618.1 hypothetical protein [Streptomyces sp. B15]
MERTHQPKPPDTPREDRTATEPATLARCREDYDGVTDARRREEARAAREGRSA